MLSVTLDSHMLDFPPPFLSTQSLEPAQPKETAHRVFKGSRKGAGYTDLVVLSSATPGNREEALLVKVE